MLRMYLEKKTSLYFLEILLSSTSKQKTVVFIPHELIRMYQELFKVLGRMFWLTLRIAYIVTRF